MNVIFQYQDVLHVICDGVIVVGGGVLREQRKKDNKAIFLIHQCVDADVFEKIVQFVSAKQAWDALATAYYGDMKL